MFSSSVRRVEEARRVIERLARIEALDRTAANPAELLEEVRSLLHEAEAWVQVEGGGAGGAAVERLRAALARDMIGV